MWRNTNEIDRKYKRNIILGVLWLLMVGLSVYLCYDYSISAMNFSPSQPVNFSHKAHIEKYGMKCTFCHSSATSSDYSNLPTTYSCMVCHIALRNETELIEKLNHSNDNDSVLAWNRIYRLPDYVHFSHKIHLRAGIDCSSCHGEVEKLDSMKLQKPFTMKRCLQCHRNPSAYIIPARTVSGIFTNGKALEFSNEKAITKPAFGKFMQEAKHSVLGINLPFKPTRGPENCSACHN